MSTNLFPVCPLCKAPSDVLVSQRSFGASSRKTIWCPHGNEKWHITAAEELNNLRKDLHRLEEIRHGKNQLKAKAVLPKSLMLELDAELFDLEKEVQKTNERMEKRLVEAEKTRLRIHPPRNIEAKNRKLMIEQTAMRTIEQAIDEIRIHIKRRRFPKGTVVEARHLITELEKLHALLAEHCAAIDKQIIEHRQQEEQK